MKPANHSDLEKHDTGHQPSGLAGMHQFTEPHILRSTLCNELYLRSTWIRALGIKVEFTTGNKQSFQKEFAAKFPKWTPPSRSACSRMREYVFRNFHDFLVEYYSDANCRMSPCPHEDMPPDYSLENDIATELEERVKGLELPPIDIGTSLFITLPEPRNRP